MNNSASIPRFPALLQQFFAERLIQQNNASPQTIASYRDTFRLFLSFAQQQLHKSPAKLELTDLDTQLVLAFLNHIERKRHNSIRTRNARLTAIRSFFHYASLRDPLSLSTLALQTFSHIGFARQRSLTLRGNAVGPFARLDLRTC